MLYIITWLTENFQYIINDWIQFNQNDYYNHIDKEYDTFVQL
jgi:hypothetical protein